MAADGYLNFDTKVNTSGFEKGTESISKVLASLDKSIKELATVIKNVSDIKFTADTSEVEKAVDDVDTSVERISETEVKIEADTSAIEPQIEAAVSETPDAEVEVTADTSQVENAAEQSKQAVESVGEATENIPSPLLDTSSAVSELDLLEKKISVLQKSLEMLSMPDMSLFDDNGEYINANAALKDYKRLEKLDSTRAKLEELEAKKKEIETDVEIDINADTSNVEQAVDGINSDMDKISESSENTSEKMSENFDDAGSHMKKSIDSSSDHITQSLDKLKSKLKGVAAAVGLAFGVKEIVSFSKEAKEAWNVQLEAETKLERVMKNTMGATREQIQATKDWASELQQFGVIGDEIQLSGLQELSTYVESADSLKTMNVVLNDMLAQQYGLNATAESAVSISTMLGKVLEGQTSALSRYGYSFTEAQEKLLKYGTEEQKVATLAEVVEASVGGMNEALAQTPAGRLKQVSNNMGDVKEQFGQAVTNIQAMFLPALERLSSALARVASLAVSVSQSLAAAFGVELDNSAAIASNISQSVASQNDLTDAALETAKAQEKSVAGFDEINKLASSDESQTKNSSIFPKIENAPLVVDAETSGASKAVIDFIGRVKKIFSKLRKWLSKNFSPVFGNIWNGLVSETKELYTTVQKIFNDIKALGQPLAEYFKGDFTIMLQNSLRVAGEILVGLYDSFNKVFSDIWSIAVYPNLTDFIIIGLPIITQFCTAAIIAFGTLFREVKTIFDMLWGDAVRPILGFITEIWHDLMVSIKDFWDKWGEPVFEKFCNAITLTGDTLEKVWKSLLKPIFDKLMEVLDNIWSKHLKPLVDNFLDFVGVMADGALDIYNKFILPVVNWFVEKFGPPIAKVFRFILETVGNVIGGVIDAVSHIISALKGVVNFVAGVFTGDWKRAWDGIKDIFSGIWNALVDVVRVPINFIIDLVNGLVGAIETGLNWIINSINKLSFEVPDWVPGIGGKKFGFDIPDIDLPEIPHLAQGTVVPANYGNFLAVLGDNKREAEVVSPISTIKKAVAEAMSENGGNAPKEIVLYTYLFPNSTAFHREVIRIVNSENSRRGG